MNDGPRPCERQCNDCKIWKHHSKFRSWIGRYGPESPCRFAPNCLDCEKKRRNERKNEDRPLAIIRRRCREHATNAGLTFEFMWIQMNWQALVPMFRAMCTVEARCLCCGHSFDNEPDIQIEHIEPLRLDLGHPDFARHHTRNLRLACGSCNGGKGPKPFPVWLDEEELERLSNDASRIAPVPASEQMDLFGLGAGGG